MNKFYTLLLTVLTITVLNNFSYATSVSSVMTTRVNVLVKSEDAVVKSEDAVVESENIVAATDSVVKDDIVVKSDNGVLENRTIIKESKILKGKTSSKDLKTMYSSLSKDAEAFYSKGNYGEALNSYLQIYDEGKMSADLYYNIANCYYKLGKNSKAILFYERAKLLRPNANIINYNLKMAKAHIVDKIESVPVFFATRWVRYFENYFTADVWAYIAVVLFLLFLFMAGCFFYSSSVRLKRNGFGIAVVALFLTICSTVFASHQYHMLNDKNSAIIMAPSVTVKGSPADSGTDLFLIHEGLKVNVKENVSGWYNIRLEDGNEGWVEANSLEII